ncbi:hypothetical protein DFH07DRAFT_780049 [Mycena maculata]|uniref:Uncharacterized protein n=1 Tax=Mycena maculata TaxID=230809 RepID=A0AAD7I581_9AGAR|nr:hypothetical protein DFH07DRAFT_780049 [Mycena maculata]
MFQTLSILIMEDFLALSTTTRGPTSQPTVTLLASRLAPHWADPGMPSFFVCLMVLLVRHPCLSDAADNVALKITDCEFATLLVTLASHPGPRKIRKVKHPQPVGLTLYQLKVQHENYRREQARLRMAKHWEDLRIWEAQRRVAVYKARHGAEAYAAYAKAKRERRRQARVKRDIKAG